MGGGGRSSPADVRVGVVMDDSAHDTGVLRSPADLWALLDEFLSVSLTDDPLRKLALGTGLNMERRLLIKRLLDNVEMVCANPATTLPYWLQLRTVYDKIEEVLAVPNEDELRTLAAKVIFRGEESDDGEDTG
jgi:hypothetical protein